MSAEQALAALERADEARINGAAYKRQIASLSFSEGLLAVARMLIDPPRRAGSIPVDALLRSVHRLGRVKSTEILRRAEVSPLKRVRELTPADRYRLRRHLIDYHQRRRLTG